MTEKNKDILSFIKNVKRKNYMSWNKYISRQIENSDFSVTHWKGSRLLEKNGVVRVNQESELLLCYIYIALGLEKIKYIGGISYDGKK